MTTPRQEYGRRGETEAIRYLKKRGYRILEQNYRNRLGEIDIIAIDGRSIVFVEVKARSGRRFGTPKWAITPKKQRKISMVALSYLKATRQTEAKARFDVVTFQSENGVPRIEIIKNAFDLAYE